MCLEVVRAQADWTDVNQEGGGVGGVSAPREERDAAETAGLFSSFFDFKSVVRLTCDLLTCIHRSIFAFSITSR